MNCVSSFVSFGWNLPVFKDQGQRVSLFERVALCCLSSKVFTLNETLNGDMSCHYHSLLWEKDLWLSVSWNIASGEAVLHSNSFKMKRGNLRFFLANIILILSDISVHLWLHFLFPCWLLARGERWQTWQRQWDALWWYGFVICFKPDDAMQIWSSYAMQNIQVNILWAQKVGF